MSDHSHILKRYEEAQLRRREAERQAWWGGDVAEAKKAAATLLALALKGTAPPHLVSQIAAIHAAIHHQPALAGLRLVSGGEN